MVNFNPKSLREARVLFTHLLILLVMEATRIGFELAFAEGMDRRTLKDPTTDHMTDSLHEIGLAQDCDLYDSVGNYLDKTIDHARLGAYWESLHPSCHWGGHFGDGNHYSWSNPEIPGCLNKFGVLRK